MKKLGKLQINSDKLMKNKELMTLKGGAGSYLCYPHTNWLPGWDDMCWGELIVGINTTDCDTARDICSDYGGTCVEGGWGDCY